LSLFQELTTVATTTQFEVIQGITDIIDDKGVQIG